MVAVKAPKGAQLLYFPMMDCTISAGFKNKDYQKKHKCVHYGVDFDSKRAVDFDGVSYGNGVIENIEQNKNSIGGVVVFRFDNVYCPKDKKVRSVIVRQYHAHKIIVKKDQKVKALQPVVEVSGTDKYDNHLHTEIDFDVRYPYHTPQVKENGSKLLRRKGATDKTIVDPLDILVVHPKQKCKVHSLADCADPVKDAPRYYEE